MSCFIFANSRKLLRFTRIYPIFISNVTQFENIKLVIGDHPLENDVSAHIKP